MCPFFRLLLLELAYFGRVPVSTRFGCKIRTDNQVNPDTLTFSAQSIERIRRQEKKKRMMKRGEKRTEELPGLLEEGRGRSENRDGAAHSLPENSRCVRRNRWCAG